MNSIISSVTVTFPLPWWRKHSSSYSKPSAGCTTAIFVIGLEYSPVGVFTFTLLTFPSRPGYTSVTRLVIHFPLNAFESCTMTKLSTQTLRLSMFHLLRGTNIGNTSVVHLLQKESTICWMNSTLFLGFLVSLKGPCGTWEDALPKSISFGHKQAPSSGSFGIRLIVRWLTRLATSKRQVYNSNGIRVWFPIAFFKAVLQLFTRASAQPFWCGAPGVVNFHCILLSAQYSRRAAMSHPSIILHSSLWAPTICFPLLLIIIAGNLWWKKICEAFEWIPWWNSQ